MRRFMIVIILSSFLVQDAVCSADEAPTARQRRSNPPILERRGAVAGDASWNKLLSDSSCDDTSRSGGEDCSSTQHLQVPVIKRRASSSPTPWHSAISESDRDIDPQRGFGRPLVVVSDDEGVCNSMTPESSGSRSTSSTEQPSQKGAEIDAFVTEQLLGLKAHTAALELVLNAHKKRRASAPDTGAGVGVGHAHVPSSLDARRFRRARKEHEEYSFVTGSNSEDEERAAVIAPQRRCCCGKPNKVGPA